MLRPSRSPRGEGDDCDTGELVPALLRVGDCMYVCVCARARVFVCVYVCVCVYCVYQFMRDVSRLDIVAAWMGSRGDTGELVLDPAKNGETTN